MKYARIADAGIGPLIDAVTAAGLPAADLTSTLWRVAWARGHDDVELPLPAFAFRADGCVVFTQSTQGTEYIALVDTGTKIWGFVARGMLPPLGARVCVQPALANGEVFWNLTVTERLGAGMRVRFDRGPDESLTGWVDAACQALDAVREYANERRRTLNAQRRGLPLPEPLTNIAEETRRRHAALVAAIDSESGPTESERRALERLTGNARRALLAEISARRKARYEADRLVLQTAVQALLLERDTRVAANVETRDALRRLEDEEAHHRLMADRAAKACIQIVAIGESNMCIDAIDTTFAPHDAAAANDLMRSIALLHMLARSSNPAHYRRP